MNNKILIAIVQSFLNKPCMYNITVIPTTGTIVKYFDTKNCFTKVHFVAYSISFYIYKYIYIYICGALGGEVVKALRYKPADHGFDSRWCHWNFSVT